MKPTTKFCKLIEVLGTLHTTDNHSDQQRWDRHQQTIARLDGKPWTPTPMPGHSRRY